MSYAYSNLDPHLQRVLSQIRINDEEWKQNKEVLQREINKIINNMKKDVVFLKIFKKLTYGGSTYENLKILAANEFDLNIELNLPFQKASLRVENSATPGFGILIVDNIDNAFTANTVEPVRRVIKKWFNYDGCLLRTKVFEWMQGVLDQALRNYTSMPIKRHMSGPALTLVFDSPELHELSVDLSPVISFGLDKWLPEPVRHYSDIPCLASLSYKVNNNVNWFMVPKSPGFYNFSAELWRISFYPCEQHIMNGQEQLKPVLKLMKFLRDKQDWKSISSYYLKTIFMWEQYEQDSTFWKKPLGELFIHMLEVVRNHLDRGWIPFFWNEKFNLLGKVNPAFTKNTANRIQRMKKRILNNLNEKPELVLAYFTREIQVQSESANNSEFDDIINEGPFRQGSCCIL